jgi:ABC-type uncharacterized transport system substrate-binding protein
MTRREFITLVEGAVVWPLAARAQQPTGRLYRIGYLTISSREQTLHLIKAFEEGLRSLTYRVGENVVIEYRFADGEMGRLPALAADLAHLGVDVIVTGANPNTVAVMKATTTIPIVISNSVDPVGVGLVLVWRSDRPRPRRRSEAIVSASRHQRWPEGGPPSRGRRV